MRLTAPQLASWKQFLTRFPIGMAILRFEPRRKKPRWELVTANYKARHVGGNSAEGYLHLPILERPGVGASAGFSDAYRKVAVTQRAQLLGHVRDDSKSQRSTVATAYPLGSDCVAIIFEDATALTRATRRVRQSETLLTRVCESAQVILWRADPETLSFTQVSKEASEILGYWPERWLHEVNFWRKHTHAADWEQLREHCAEAAASGSEQRFEARMRRPRGEMRWFRIYVMPIAGAQGRRELSGMMVDITDHKRVESATRDLARRIMRAQERERRRVSRDLHESIGQYLTGIKATISVLLHNGECNGEVRQKLGECMEHLALCVEETRSISQMLYPPILELLGLAPALRSFVENFELRSGVQVQLDLQEGDKRLEPTLETTLFRIVQESLTNVEQHAGCDQASVRLTYDAREVLLEIADEGKGMDAAARRPGSARQDSSGIGLLKMRERVNELQGTLRIESAKNGTVVRVEIPRGAKKSEMARGQRTKSKIDGCRIDIRRPRLVAAGEGLYQERRKTRISAVSIQDEKERQKPSSA